MLHTVKRKRRFLQSGTLPIYGDYIDTALHTQHLHNIDIVTDEQ